MFQSKPIRPKIDWEVKNYYKTPHDIVQYIDGTIVVYESVPYYAVIQSTTDVVKVRLCDLETRDTAKTVNASDVDIHSPELGYMNYSTKDKHGKPLHVVLYIRRHPYKKFKQGICSVNTAAYNIDGKPSPYYFEDVLWSKGFKQMLLGNHSSLDEAFGTMMDAGDEVALSRELALRLESFGIYSLWFKGEGIGYIEKYKKELKISPDLKFGWVIQEYLNEINTDWVITQETTKG